MILKKIKDKLPFVGSILLHLGLILGLLFFNLNSNSLQSRTKVIPIRLIEIREDITSPVKASLKKSSHSVDEMTFPKTIFPEKLFFSERNFKNEHKERISLSQEAGAVDMNIPLPDPCPSPTSGEGRREGEREKRLKDSFLIKVRERIERVKRYPRGAQLSRIEGKTIVKFRLSAEGEVNAISLISSSCYPILDNEAKKTVERASPFPPFPEGLKKKEIEITVPITFRLKD